MKPPKGADRGIASPMRAGRSCKRIAKTARGTRAASSRQLHAVFRLSSTPLREACRVDPNAYDLVVIGSGPAGQKGAIAAAKLGKRVAVVDKKERIGGVCLHTGTIPSKTLRESILYLSGYRQRAFYGRDYSLKDEISVGDLT